MSFLKKLGEVLNAGSGLLPIVGPLINIFAPKAAPGVQNVSDELPKIAAIIAQIEAIGQAMQLPGAKKLEIAAPMVAQIVLASPLMAGKSIQDQVLFMKGVTGIAGGMADLLNSLNAAVVENPKLAA
jgi:hypothetical protein